MVFGLLPFYINRFQPLNDFGIDINHESTALHISIPENLSQGLISPMSALIHLRWAGRNSWNNFPVSLLFQGAKPEETAAGSSGGSVTDAKPSGSSASGASADKVSTDKYRNYAVLAGTITALGAIGWYLKASKKPQEVQDWTLEGRGTVMENDLWSEL